MSTPPLEPVEEAEAHPPPPEAQSEEIRRALEATAPPVHAVDVTKPDLRPLRITIFLLSTVLLGALVFWLDHSVTAASLSFPPIVRRVVLALSVAAAILSLYEASRVLVVGRFGTPVARYNVRRILKLAVAALIAFWTVSILFAGWYATVVSLGLFSLILGLALQNPITSFFGWIYLLAQGTYRVGDRIRIGEATGDVIDVGYISTTLWEFGGELLSSDHPSGRLVKFPNSLVFSTPVYNYSWPLFPYIWNEITIQVAYDSDLAFVGETMKEVVEEERGTAMKERVKAYRSLLARTPVNELEVDDKPTVLFRPNPYSWVDTTVRYLVYPRRSGRVKTRLIQKILERLNAEPERVRLPKGNTR